MSKEASARKIVEKLVANGHQALFAGGCVRDRLRGVEPKDFDIATSAHPHAVQKMFEKTIPVGAAFGVILVVEDETSFEVATFRTEGGYQDGRRPTQVAYAGVNEDASRRDFTVNGLYFDVKKNEVIDLVGGQADLKKKVIRTIGKPEDRFIEDHLRMLRAIRFAVQLDFEIDSATIQAVKKHASKLSKISQERIREEFSKIMTSPDPLRGIKLCDETKLLDHILPEMEKMKGVEQPMEFHPEGDVWVHTLMLVEGLKNAPIELAMGVLLHDVAKPATFDRAPDRIRFHGHDTLGAEMAKDICKRLAFSNDQTHLISELVLHHLRFKDAKAMRLSTLKRFIGMDRFDLHLELHRLDCLASHGNLDAYHFCKEKQEEFAKLPPPPSKLVTGQDLIELGHKPGPEFAKVLRAMEDGVLEGTITTREQAIDFVRKNFGKV